MWYTDAQFRHPCVVLLDLTHNISLYIDFPCSSLLAKCVYIYPCSQCSDLYCVLSELPVSCSARQAAGRDSFTISFGVPTLCVRVSSPYTGLAPPPPGLVHCKGQYVLYCCYFWSLKSWICIEDWLCRDGLTGTTLRCRRGWSVYNSQFSVQTRVLFPIYLTF